jgi:hypothetical protein
MVYNRKGIAPWSLNRKGGIQSATVDGDIEVPQYVQPTIDTGFVSESGDWKGLKVSDETFKFYSKDEAIPNAGEVQAPADIGSLSMVGFNDLQIAIRVTNGGNFAISAVMASDGSQPYYNLRPPNAAARLRGVPVGQPDMEDLFVDAADSLTADVWNIFIIQGRLSNQARLGFKIVNNSGGESDIETSFLRLV